MYYGSLKALRKENGSYGLVATSYIPAGKLVHILTGEAKQRTKFTIEQGGKHYVDDKIMYMNHSCDPNCMIRNKEITTIKPLQPFTELTFDYATTEKHILHSFQCFCGSYNCRGKIY